MVLKLSNEEVIELPIDYNLEERLKLVNEILEQYPDEFKYREVSNESKFGMKVDSDMIIKIRLDILATYLIRHDMAYVQSKDIMSSYKQKARPLQEIPFSQFSKDFNDINGMY